MCAARAPWSAIISVSLISWIQLRGYLSFLRFHLSIFSEKMRFFLICKKPLKFIYSLTTKLYIVHFGANWVRLRTLIQFLNRLNPFCLFPGLRYTLSKTEARLQVRQRKIRLWNPEIENCHLFRTIGAQFQVFQTLFRGFMVLIAFFLF